jgi:adenylylsulfate kinase
LDQRQNIFHQSFEVTKEQRQALHGHKSYILWFTGLSGSGKSTIANIIERKLHELGISTYILDGDNLREGLNQNLRFSPEDRKENIRRTGEIAKLFVDSGIVVLATLISPYAEDRKRIRKRVAKGEFIEIYVKCSLEVCEMRDIKGLYKRAREGELTNMTGISAPYEEPETPEIVIETNHFSSEECGQEIINYLRTNGYIT